MLPSEKDVLQEMRPCQINQPINDLLGIFVSDLKLLLSNVIEGSTETGNFARSLFYTRIKIFSKALKDRVLEKDEKAKALKIIRE